MAALPPVVLDPLPLPNVRDGLFQVATGPIDLPAHVGVSGATWETDLDGVGHTMPIACQDPPYPALADDGPSGLVQAYAFDVYATLTFPPIGHSEAEHVRRVRARLQMNEQRQVEAALWGGNGVAGAGAVAGVFQTLATAGKLTTVTPDAATLVEAVSALEQAGTVYPGSVLLHARPRLGAYVAQSFQTNLTAASKPNETIVGSRWVFGAGYAGTGPAGEAVDATSEWMYATGRVILWRAPDVWVSPPGQMIDRAGNQRHLVARRTYAVAVEGFAAAIKVTRA